MADYLSAREGLLELSLIVFGVWAIVAFLGGKAGYRMGAKRAAAEIADFFLHEITSSNNDLKSIPALLARQRVVGHALDLAHQGGNRINKLDWK